MNTYNEYHVHPRNPSEKIFGRIIQVEEVLKKGDVYNARSGKWKSIPDKRIDTKVGKDDKATFIRAVL